MLGQLSNGGAGDHGGRVKHHQKYGGPVHLRESCFSFRG
jgi:hypothetical protein